MAGKTGTTNDQSDGWFIGYTPQILAGAWVGADDRFLHFRTLSSGQGASTALPIFAAFMKKAESDSKSGVSNTAKFMAPKGFVDCEELSVWGSDSTGYDHRPVDSTNEPKEEIPPSEWR